MRCNGHGPSSLSRSGWLPPRTTHVRTRPSANQMKDDQKNRPPRCEMNQAHERQLSLPVPARAPARLARFGCHRLAVALFGAGLIGGGCGSGSGASAVDLAQSPSDEDDIEGKGFGGESDSFTAVTVSLVGGDTGAVRGTDGQFHV